MRDILGRTLQSRAEPAAGDDSARLSAFVSTKTGRRSCSLETILDQSPPLSRQQLFLSRDSLPSSQEESPVFSTRESSVNPAFVFKTSHLTHEHTLGVLTRRKQSMGCRVRQPGAQKSPTLRPRSASSCLDIIRETKEEDARGIQWSSRATSCLNVNVDPPSSSSSSSSSHRLFSLSSDATKARGPDPTSSTSDLWEPAAVRRCFSSLDVSKLPRSVSQLKLPVCVAARTFQNFPQPKPEHSKTFSRLHVCVLLLCRCQI